MAIQIKPARLNNLLLTNPPTVQDVDIITDTEEEVQALGVVVTDKFGHTVECDAGSMAHAAGSSTYYELSPSGVWKKMA